MGVVTGPLSATLLRRIESMSSTGSVWPERSNASRPARWRSHSIATPDAFRIRTTASVTSGPMPSPGIKVMVCVMEYLIAKNEGRGTFSVRALWLSLPDVPEEQRQAQADVDEREHLREVRRDREHRRRHRNSEHQHNDGDAGDEAR